MSNFSKEDLIKQAHLLNEYKKEMINALKKCQLEVLSVAPDEEIEVSDGYLAALEYLEMVSDFFESLKKLEGVFCFSSAVSKKLAEAGVTKIMYRQD